MNFMTGKSPIDKLLSNTGHLQSLEQAVTNNMYGIDPLQRSKYTIPNKETSGFTFIVRPSLNLGDRNVFKNPEFYDLQTEDKYSVWLYLRGLLDPLWASRNPGKISPFLDHRNAFIPFITNNIESISGFVSEVLPTRETLPGLAKEQMFMPDGIKNLYGIYDIDTELKNTAGNVVDKMLNIWLTYMGFNHLGKTRPYPHLFANHILDWPTRIYRLIMSDDMKFVTQIACTGYSAPVNTESGKIFDFNKETLYSDVTSNRTIRFKSAGIIYNDIRYMDSFNWSVGVFNPAMRDLTYKINNNIPLDVIKLPDRFYNMFAHRAYPHINLVTFELEWYIMKNSVKEIFHAN